MAKDLGSGLSPHEYMNMLPLDLLAAVASETLKNYCTSEDCNSEETPGVDVPRVDTPKAENPDIVNSEIELLEVKTANNFKKQVKKSTNVLTLDDIRSLPIKSLVDKFSEMTSDELTKKYFYKCLLLPNECTMTFKSFGNEKKAYDKIKSHLLSHVEQLILKLESNDEVSEIVFVPKSPSSTSKNAEKIPKKSLRKQQTSIHQDLARSTSFKVSKKEKNSELPVKKVKKKVNVNKKMEKIKAEFKNCFGKNKTKMWNSVYLKKNYYIQQCNNDQYLPSDEELLQERLNGGTDEEMNMEWESESYCSNYSKHLKYISFSDAIKEKFPESDSEHMSDSDDYDNSFCEKNKSFMFLHDHNYACFDEVKRDSLEFKHVPRKYEDPFLYQPNVKTQLIIRTPPFPFVHTPLLPEVAEIKEIDEVECHCGAVECSKYANYLSGTSRVKNDVEEMQSDEHSSDSEEKYSASVFYKMNSASSSVLECVENIVNKKHSNSCVPKSDISSNENDENSENNQKVERELALKYIAKLHSKGKKKIPDSLICQICPDKHFTAQATLIHHYRSHAGIKPYMCELCSSKFTRQHSLNYHMLIHQNRSRFTCEFCGRTFRHPSHYKEHLRRHTGETPYHCTDCNLHFKTRNTFKRHLKTRHGKLLTASGIEDLNAE